MDEAAAADAEIELNAELGPLHGLPVTIKDLFDTRGLTTTLGTIGLANNIPDSDAAVVEVLKQAGAIIVGKTNTAELGWSWRRTRNLVHGTTYNPYHRPRTTAGSSGGSAAAVTSCMSFMDIASDTGGSIRMPASFCGLIGLKPTAGLISEAGFMNTGRRRENPIVHMNSVGPLARFVDDVDLAFRVLVSSPSGITDASYSYVNYNTVDLSSLKVGYHYQNAVGNMPVSEVVDTVNNALTCLDGSVRSLTRERPSTSLTARSIYTDIFSINGADAMIEILDAAGTPQSMATDYARSAISFFNGRRLSPILARLIPGRVETFVSEFEQYFERYDVLISPVFGNPVPNESNLPVVEFDNNLYCQDHNLTGYPVVAVPAGVDPNGLPIGVQIVARPYEEHVAVAKQIELKLGGWSAAGVRIVKKPKTIELWRLGAGTAFSAEDLSGEWSISLANPYTIPRETSSMFFYMR
jgi:amidase